MKYKINEKEYPIDTETFEITLKNNKTLNIPIPTAKLFLSVVKYQNLTPSDDVEKIYKALNKICFNILRTNVQKEKISFKQVGKMSMAFKMEILKSFIDFTKEITERKNLNRPLCQFQTLKTKQKAHKI